jgi:diaminohydroxyphosphoribosylaminopyrimidine deaminase/5-amino-6-(5-phosphoribosylamino)uracil reductase
MMEHAGIDVTIGILRQEALALNREFFTVQTKDRPYIYLKWAQTKNGFIDKIRDENEAPQPTPISNDFSKMLVHEKRAGVSAIMVGTNTVIKDNPSLTTRNWFGKNPVRVIPDRQERIPADYAIFDGKADTIVFTEKESHPVINNVTFIRIPFNENVLYNIFAILKKRKINSILVEGGRELLQSIIDKRLWDEAFIEVSDITFDDGVKAPVIEGHILNESDWGASRHIHIRLG